MTATDDSPGTVAAVETDFSATASSRSVPAQKSRVVSVTSRSWGDGVFSNGQACVPSVS